jgi:hypothetical protein
VGVLAPQGAVFLSALLIARLAGPAAVGFVEAARLVGAPLQVLATGLSATAAPRLLEAGRIGAEPDGRHETRRYGLGILVIGVPYLALVGWAWPWNPLAGVVPLAYQIEHLAALSVVAAIVFALTAPPRYELLGGNRVRSLTLLEGSASAVQCVVSLGAAVMGAFAGPVGVIAQSLGRWVLLWPARRRMYAQVAAEPRRDERLPYQRAVGDGWIVQYAPEAVERLSGHLDLDQEAGVVRTVDWADAGELQPREPSSGDPPRLRRN